MSHRQWPWEFGLASAQVAASLSAERPDPLWLRDCCAPVWAAACPAPRVTPSLSPRQPLRTRGNGPRRPRQRASPRTGPTSRPPQPNLATLAPRLNLRGLSVAVWHPSILLPRTPCRARSCARSLQKFPSPADGGFRREASTFVELASVGLRGIRRRLPAGGVLERGRRRPGDASSIRRWTSQSVRDQGQAAE